MSLRKDRIQLDIIIGNDNARKQLAELEAEAAGLKKTIRDVKSEHKKYERAVQSMTGVEKNMQRSKEAAKELENELTGLKAEYIKVQAEIKQTGNADSKLIAKEKELKEAIRVKNTELQIETNRFKSLEKQQIKLIAVMNRTKQASDEYVQASKKLKEVEAKMQGIRNAFDITKMTMRELSKEAKTLKMQLNNAIPGSEAYKRYETRLQAVNSRMKELSLNSKIAAAAQLTLRQKFNKGADFFNKYAASIVSTIAAFAGLIMSARKAIDIFNQFEQAEADLSALTGLTGDKLYYLSDAAREMSTSITKNEIRIKNSAIDIEKAFGIIGYQRPELLKSKEALKMVTEEALILAAASYGILEPATIAVTSALNNFVLAADQTRRVINTLAAGSKEGAADIPKLTKVLDKAATTANLMGLEIEDLVGIAEAVAPKFNDMRLAGNSIDKVFLNQCFFIFIKGLGYNY